MRILRFSERMKMKKFSIKDLAQIIKAVPLSAKSATGGLNTAITGVSIDSRTIKTGDCFFAIAGDNFDGHDYINDAFDKGAVCTVVSRKIANRKKLNAKRYTLYANKILRVDDTIKALASFAGAYRRQGSFKVVAITGSAGKTTTRQIAYHVLKRHYRCYQAPKNFNNALGLPLTLLGAGPEDKIIIAELGSNSPGELAYLTQIAEPDIALVTNVHPAHLAGFGNLEAIVREKLSISEGLRPDGVLIINGDYSRLVDTCRAENAAFITFGKSDRCDIQAQNITYKAAGSSFTIDGTPVQLPLPGPGNVENAIAAWSICSQFGETVDDFACALKTLPAVPMRTELLQRGRLTILNDCYNANPASMKNALDILANLGSEKNRRLVFICGDMAELGRQTEQLHAQLGLDIAKSKVKLLLTVGKLAKIVADAAKDDAEYDLQTKSFEDTVSACNNLGKFIKDYDIILVKGSRTVRLENVVEKLKTLFS